MKKFVMILLVVVLMAAVVVAGCSKTEQAPAAAAEESAGGSAAATEESAGSAEGTAKDPADIKIAFICKILNDEWFRAEDNAMKAAAAGYGIEYVAIDCNMNNDKNMQAVENVITEEYDGVVICVTDQGLSKAVADRFAEVGMPVIAIDDALIDGNGENMVPYVGVKAYEFGYEGGEHLAEMATERDFFAEGNNTMVMVGTTSQLQHSAAVGKGHVAALKDKIPELTDDMILEVDCHTLLFDDAMKAMSATFNAHPEVDHWIIPCVDDPVAYAAFKLLQENSFPLENVLLVGYCAYSPTYQILTSGLPIADNYFSLALRPDLEGKACIDFMYDYLVNGTPIPEETRYGEGFVDISNYEEHFKNAAYGSGVAEQVEAEKE